MPTDLGFYHCTRQPAREVAVRLAEKAWLAGQRLLILSDPDTLADLDQSLWTRDPASFLPHGLAGTADDPEQPILLAPEMRAPAPNGARLLMLVGLPLPPPPEAEQFDRILLLFEDGSDAHARARADWRAAADRATIERSYWQQTESGGWARRTPGG